ncbi:unnamed protein product, partial [Tetraodon nigroviridis]
GPFFFIGGTNGAAIVSSYCERKGWKRIYNKQRDDFKLKWCETKSAANYCNFREDSQRRGPHHEDRPAQQLRDYEGVSAKISHGRGPRSRTVSLEAHSPEISPHSSRRCVALCRRPKMAEFIPTTFRMDLRTEREDFFSRYGTVSNIGTKMWICKPTGLNQGRGIFLLKSQDDVTAFRLKLQNAEDSQASQASRRTLQRQPQPYIVQQYIQNPLLLNGKKFDVRSYLLIACTCPFVVFFRHGYVRLSCNLYDPRSSDPSTHLTNQCMQKKNPLYSQLKEDTVWSMESFNTYVNNKFRVAMGLPWDWVLGTFTKRMQQIMTQCFFAVKSKLDRRLGFFDLIGCDFLVDADFKVWLLEMNCNPALHTNCEVLKEVVPSTVMETLGELEV